MQQTKSSELDSSKCELLNLAIARLIQSHGRSFFNFLIVGGLSAGINFATFTLLWKFAHLHYQVAVTIAFICTVLFHFNANRIITFKKHGSHIYSHILKYIIMIIVNYVITLIVVHIVVENLHYSPYVGLVCSILTNLGSNYLMSRFWVFKH